MVCIICGKNFNMERELTKEEQDEFNEVMSSYDNFMKKHHDNCNRINNRILRAIKNIKGEKFYKDLLRCMEENEVGDGFNIVKKPRGEAQKEKYGRIKEIWVSQQAVGDSGDSWEGTVSVKIKDDKWLEMPFSM